MAISQLKNVINSSITVESISGLKETTVYVAKTFFKCYSLYCLYSVTLSDVLCLKTYRHGTNPYAAAMITLRGPDYERAGKGGEALFMEESTGRRSPYAARDQALKAFYMIEDFCAKTSVTDAFFYYVKTKWQVKTYSKMSTLGFVTSKLPLSTKVRCHLISIVSLCLTFSGFIILFPTVKLHVKPERSNETHPNFDGGPGARYTKTFSVSDIGFLGIMKNGMNGAIFTRIYKNPKLLLWGTVQGIFAVVFTIYLFPNLIPSNRPAVARVFTALKNSDQLTYIQKVALFCITAPCSVYIGLQF